MYLYYRYSHYHYLQRAQMGSYWYWSSSQYGDTCWYLSDPSPIRGKRIQKYNYSAKEYRNINTRQNTEMQILGKKNTEIQKQQESVENIFELLFIQEVVFLANNGVASVKLFILLACVVDADHHNILRDIWHGQSLLTGWGFGQLICHTWDPPCLMLISYHLISVWYMWYQAVHNFEIHMDILIFPDLLNTFTFNVLRLCIYKSHIVK